MHLLSIHTYKFPLSVHIIPIAARRCLNLSNWVPKPPLADAFSSHSRLKSISEQQTSWNVSCVFLGARLVSLFPIQWKQTLLITVQIPNLETLLRSTFLCHYWVGDMAGIP